MDPAIAALITAARATGARHVAVHYPTTDRWSRTSILLTAHTDEHALQMAAEYGLPAPTAQSDGTSEWVGSVVVADDVRIAIEGPSRAVRRAA